MFCPSCKDEFRPGFTHCAGCDVDLVESLDDVPPAAGVVSTHEAPGSPPPLRVPMTEFCGFLELDEVRAARDRLRESRIAADILIREAPDGDPGQPIREEYWLRIEQARFREGVALLEEGS